MRKKGKRIEEKVEGIEEVRGGEDWKIRAEGR